MAELKQLHAGTSGMPALVFVHGLGGHPIETWRHTSLPADDFWPHWVGRDTACDTWVLGYDAKLSAWQGQAMPLPDQGDQVADLLASEPGLKGRALALIGHSMGGLVIKTLLIQGRTKGDPRIEELVTRVIAVTFVATPHAGSQLANLARALGWLLRTNEQVGNMSSHDPYLAQLNQQFRHAREQTRLQVKVFAERQDVSVGKTLWGVRIPLGGVRVVSPTSGDPGLPDVTVVPMDGDHFSICKPKDRDAHIHKSLCDFIKGLPPRGSTAGTQDTGTAVAAAISTALEATAPCLERESGRLTGPADNRLEPREGRLYGRETEVARVLHFLLGQGDGAVVTAKEISGVAGIGKTEICKAALKAWLQQAPQSVAYYVDVPDRAGVGELVSRMARAVGAPDIDNLEALLSRLPPGLYYLDNLESVAEQQAGQDALRLMRRQPGVRLLVSSRVSLQAVFGKAIVVGVLPADAALRLFRELWAGVDQLPADLDLRRFVVHQLGAHALSVTLVARLGDCYPYSELVRRWQSIGTASAQDPQDRSRHGSLAVSLHLTAEALGQHDGTLALWVATALFSSGLSDDLLRTLEIAGGWSNARLPLVRHHVLARRDERWHMLPPLARYAMDASLKREAGFDWAAARPPLQELFERVSGEADSVASTDIALAARRWLVNHFDSLARLMQREMSAASPDLRWLASMHERLINQYQFQAGLARDLLVGLVSKLDRPASALKALGDLEGRLGRPDEARGLYDRARVLYEKEQAGLGQANTLKALGDLERRLGRPDEARGLYDRA
ncbi:MAG: tetratricopeptide repeat protein, partial [Burkholderiaceae bacterium]